MVVSCVVAGIIVVVFFFAAFLVDNVVCYTVEEAVFFVCNRWRGCAVGTTIVLCGAFGVDTAFVSCGVLGWIDRTACVDQTAPDQRCLLDGIPGGAT